jgi:hypothetical protein
MVDLAYNTIRDALAQQELFEDKTWQLSPRAWPLTAEQRDEIETIGKAALEFYQALEWLYTRSLAGKNLLRNKPLVAPWVAEYLDRGKPPVLLRHARDARLRGTTPNVIRPDLLLTQDGWALTELDSVPGGIGLTAFLNRLYGGTDDPAIVGAKDAMIAHFHASLVALAPGKSNPSIVLLVSDEAATYRPEMSWLAEELQRQGRRVFCMRPDEIFPLGGALFFDSEGTPEKVDVIYRFFELFDFQNITTAPFIIEAWENGEVAIAPPMRPFQEEKLSLALFHHHLLQDFWAENLSKGSLKILRKLIPKSWIIDPTPLPPAAVLDAPTVGGRTIYDWRQLGLASQKERDLIIKISGFHETAWGARSVTLGSDCSREEWQTALDAAINLGSTHLHILQEYKKPRRETHAVYDNEGNIRDAEGRLRLCPYFFVVEGETRLGGALATFCPPDKKIIHGMQDAVLLPCRVTDGVKA